MSQIIQTEEKNKRKKQKAHRSSEMKKILNKNAIRTIECDEKRFKVGKSHQ